MHFMKKVTIRKTSAGLLLLFSLVTIYTLFFRSVCFLTNFKEFREGRIISQTKLDLELSFNWEQSDLKVNFNGSNFYGTRLVKEVSCIHLFAGNTSYIDKAKQIATKPHKRVTSKDYLLMTKDCTQFVNNRGYITDALTKEEKEFPIAYTILLYENIAQAERLLRAIYRPQNTYCIHIDWKADLYDISAIKSIANCFDNVFVVKSLINVKWGQFTVLQAELLCIELLVRKKGWKYFINLTGQEFPLKTNYELVKILQAYNGANDVDFAKRQNKILWNNTIPPQNVTPTKGAAHVAVNREFVEYIVNNKTAKDILEWVKTVVVPDETYFSTLNHNPHLGIKGSYKGNPRRDNEKPFLARFKKWRGHRKCAGKWIRDICIFGIGDLKELSERPELFANKFLYDYEHFAFDCMEELIFNKSRDAFLKHIPFDNTYYKNLDFVKYKID